MAFAVLATAPLQAAPYAAIVMDARTGEILFEENANTRLHPASLTKMMTLYIAFQEIEAGRLSLDTMVTVSKYAASQPPSRLGLKPGQKIALRYLIRAAAVKSANDAASAIGDHISGDHVAFAKRMTRTAKQLGMNSTTFRNANGLTAEGHLSTARDMNILGRHLFYDFPQYYNIFSRRTADAGVAQVTNTNSRFLDGYEGADGIKTGYTNAAGFNLTASARRGNKHIIATVFGGTSTVQRNAKMRELMDLGFGVAKNKVKEQPPKAPAMLPEDALIASAAPDIDEWDAEGGAGKTIRVSGEVRTSLRPRPRPDLPEVPAEIAVALAEGIEGALAEATADPAPAGTLEFQAEVMAVAALPEAEAEPLALALAEVDATTDAALLALKPKARPEGMAEAEETAAVDAPILLAEAVPEDASHIIAALPEVTVELPVEDVQIAMAASDALDSAAVDERHSDALPSDLLVDLTEVETVAGAVANAPQTVDFAAATVTAPSRKAPIFESIEPEAVEVAAGEEVAQEVVIVMSTSGGRHFGVHVGEFPSRYEAERALLKTALAESATLNEGLRKTSQAGGKWRASFMGLTEEQAQLACRRLRARAVPCETVGG